MKKLLFLIIPAVLLVTACGGGGGSSSPNPDGGTTSTTTSVGGLVSDPAISGATVELRLISDDSVAVICGTTGQLTCRDYTDENGEFAFVLPEDADLTLYYVKSFGGIDTETNVDMESFSFESPLAAFTESKDEIVVSPITTIMMQNGGTIEEMKAHAKQALGLSDSADVLADPSGDTELFKKSYLLVSLAIKYREMVNEQGAQLSDEPFELIAGATVNGTSTQKLFEDNGNFVASRLNVIYDDFDDDADYADKVAELQETAQIIKDTEAGSDVVSSIVAAQIEKLIENAVGSLITDEPETVSEQYTANVALFVEALKQAAANLPAEKFIVYQLVRYVVASDYSLSGYDDFISENFAANLTALADNEQFAEDVANIVAAGPAYVVSVPLGDDDLLADTNEAIASYYYNSNINLGYKARKLTADVRDDDLNDEINLRSVLDYSKGGHFAKATAIADSLIIKTLNKAKAYRYIAKYINKHGGASDDASAYAQKAESLLKGIREADPTEPFTKDEAGELVSLMRTYSAIGDAEREATLKTYIDAQIDSLDESYKTTIFSRFISALSGFIEDLVDEGASIAEIESATEDLVGYIENLPLGTRTGKRYSSHLIYYVDVLGYYVHTENKAKVIDVYTNYMKPKYEADNSEGGTQWMFYLSKATGALYWAGENSEAEMILSMITKDSYRLNAVKGIILVSSKDDYDAAVTSFESVLPLDSDYGNVDDYIDAWVYFAHNRANEGVALEAIESGDSVLATKALDYATGKLDAAVAYMAANSVDFTGELDVFVSSSNREGERGYVKIATLYSELGDNETALAQIDKAISYTDNCTDSVNKTTAYATIAFHAQDIDPSYDVASVLAKARAVFASAEGDANFENEDLADIKLNIAKDYIMLDDYESAKTELASAMTYAAGIFTGATGQTYKEAYEEADTVRVIAETYASAGDMASAIAGLEVTATATQDIDKDSTRVTRYEYILKSYAELGLYDLGLKKAKIFFADSYGDYIDGMDELIKAMLAGDAFEDEDVATYDLDKDGKPDFFDVLSSEEDIAESGLERDDDIDGDGKLNTVDATPFYAD